jgi:hypothetical protein
MEINIEDHHIEYLVKYALGSKEEICKNVDLLVSEYLLKKMDFKFSNKISNIIKNHYFHNLLGSQVKEQLVFWENTLNASSKIKDEKACASHKSLSKMLRDIYNIYEKNKDVEILAADSPPFIGYVVCWIENSLEKSAYFTIELKDAFKEENKEIKEFMGSAESRTSLKNVLKNVSALKKLLKI